MISPFRCYQIYRAIHLHFTTPYDYFRYNGAVTVKPEKFNTHKDRFRFASLGTKFNEERHLMLFFARNFLSKKASWIGNLQDEKAMEVYRSALSNVSSISYIMTNEINGLQEEKSISFKDSLSVCHGSVPFYTAYLQGKISPETLAAMENAYGIVSKWQELGVIGLDKLICYSPFVFIDYDKVRTVMRGMINKKLEGGKHHANEKNKSNDQGCIDVKDNVVQSSHGDLGSNQYEFSNNSEFAR